MSRVLSQPDSTDMFDDPVHAASRCEARSIEQDITFHQPVTGINSLQVVHQRDCLLPSYSSAPGNADRVVTYYDHHGGNNYILPVPCLNEQTIRSTPYQVTPRRNIRSVPLACTNCREVKKKCDSGEPCSRCMNVGKANTCVRATKKITVRRTGPPSQHWSILDSAGASVHPAPLLDTAQQYMDPATHTLGGPFHASGSRRGPVDYLMVPSLGNAARYHSADHTYPPGTTSGWQSGSIIDSEIYCTGFGDIPGNREADSSEGQYSEEAFDYTHGAGASGNGARGGGLRFRPY